MTDQSKVRDLAIVFPWFGVFLFAPPVLLLFRPETTIFGIPALPIYLFFMWFLLIIGSWMISRHLVEEPARSPETGTQETSLFPKE